MARPKAQIPGETVTQIIDCAENLICHRGYNGFSYRDIAEHVGIRTASIHYHFPTKGDLAAQVAKRYGERFNVILQSIADRDPNPVTRLEAYAGLFRTALAEHDRMCLCGMLGAESATLPEPVRLEVESFFQINRDWLETVIAEGERVGKLSLRAPAPTQAHLLLAAMEGGMMLARNKNDTALFDLIAHAAIEPLAA